MRASNVLSRAVLGMWTCVRPDLQCIQVVKDDIGKVALLEVVDLCGDVFGSVGRGYRAFCLEEDASVVVLGVDQMDGDSGLGLVVGDDRLVDVVAVHALSAILWYQ